MRFQDNSESRCLVLGGSGYVGSQLIPSLQRDGVPPRCMARSPDRLIAKIGSASPVVEGDIRDRNSLVRALDSVDTVYYLIHLMTGSSDFASEDRRAAHNLVEAARNAGTRRIIYLGGLGDDGAPDLSPHLRSRQEVGRIFRESGIETIEFRASVIIGSGSLSFQLIRSLCDRLPIMLCPTWVNTPTQPIAIDDVVAYLHAARTLPGGESRIIEIGGTDVTSYGGMIREYARLRGLRRWLISVPVLTPYLSSLWLAVVTPAAFEVGRHLIEGLRNPTVVRGSVARETFPITPFGMREAMERALAAEQVEVTGGLRISP